MPSTTSSKNDALLLARRIADLFQADPRIDAIALSGSHTSGAEVDSRSDIDLFIYSAEGDFPLEQRRAILERLGGAARASLGLTFWGSGDAWFDACSGFEVDVVYSSKTWLEQALDRLLRRCEPSGGYSTCVWHTVRSARILFDRSGWLTQLQTWSDQPYPAGLRRAIIEHNFPILRDVIPSYRYNIEKSLPRRDLVFINNEVTWMLASYFDVLFAFNSVPHPGAKRLLEQVWRLCPRRPSELAAQVNEILQLAGVGDGGLLTAIDRLVDGLGALLREDGLIDLL